MKKRFQIYFSLALCILLAASCQKMKRPALGEYPRDANPPGGPLRFYAAFDGTTANPLFNAVDSIRANFASENALTAIPGISGQAVQGIDQKAIKYTSANDFGANASSFSLSVWIKNTVPGGGNPQFLFSLAHKDLWAESAMFILVEHAGGGSTVDSAVVKFYIDDTKSDDHWFETVGTNRLYRILDNNWHHLVFTYDETTSNMKIYRDGQLAKTLSWAGHGKIQLDPSKLNGLVVGGMNKHVSLGGPGDPWIQSWQGGLDQFRLYSKVLSDSEVLALYNSKL